MIFSQTAPQAALRTAVFGFLIGICLGTLFVVTIFVLDLGHVATLTKGDGLPLGELGFLPVTFGLLGLVAAPALGVASGDVSD